MHVVGGVKLIAGGRPRVAAAAAGQASGDAEGQFEAGAIGDAVNQQDAIGPVQMTFDVRRVVAFQILTNIFKNAVTSND